MFRMERSYSQSCFPFFQEDQKLKLGKNAYSRDWWDGVNETTITLSKNADTFFFSILIQNKNTAKHQNTTFFHSQSNHLTFVTCTMRIFGIWIHCKHYVNQSSNMYFEHEVILRHCFITVWMFLEYSRTVGEHRKKNELMLACFKQTQTS